MNIFSSSQPLDKLPIQIFGEIIQLNSTESFGSQQPSQHIYEWNGGWHWKVLVYGVYFWLASYTNWPPKIWNDCWKVESSDHNDHQDVISSAAVSYTLS